MLLVLVEFSLEVGGWVCCCLLEVVGLRERLGMVAWVRVKGMEVRLEVLCAKIKLRSRKI